MENELCDSISILNQSKSMYNVLMATLVYSHPGGFN